MTSSHPIASTGSRRPRLADASQDAPSDDVTSPRPDDGLSAKQAAAFAALVANADHAAIERTLDQMDAVQLRELTIALATQLTAQVNTQTTTDSAAGEGTGEVIDVGPTGICATATAAAAQSFGTTREAILSADRHRTVTDARAVAMTAARRGGLTLPAIATYFNKDHTSVIYAQTKVAGNPRLDVVCARILDQLQDHYARPVSLPTDPPDRPVDRPVDRPDAADPDDRARGVGPAAERSATLQLAALEQARSEGGRRHDEGATHVAARAAAPAAR